MDPGQTPRHQWVRQRQRHGVTGAQSSADLMRRRIGEEGPDHRAGAERGHSELKGAEVEEERVGGSLHLEKMVLLTLSQTHG